VGLRTRGRTAAILAGAPLWGSPLGERTLTSMGSAFARIVGSSLQFNRCSDPACFDALMSRTPPAVGEDRTAASSRPGMPVERPSPTAA
jgi:hypothetical protein